MGEGKGLGVPVSGGPDLTFLSWQATATYFCVMSMSMSYRVVFSATWCVLTKLKPSGRCGETGRKEEWGALPPPSPPAHSQNRCVSAAPVPRRAAEEGLEQGGCFGAGLGGEEGSPPRIPTPYLVSSAEINAFISPAADQLHLPAACSRRTQG